MGEYFDISPVVSSQLAVFPGDQPFEHQKVMSFEAGQHLELSYIKSTVHIGAHADAPSHYQSSGAAIHQRSLSIYLGLAQVMRVNIKRGARILPSDLNDEIKAPRLLFATESYPNPNEWNEDFNSLSPELILKLSAQRVKLVGIDTPSIDPWDSKELESHQAVAKNDMAILEGLVLQDVKPGLYNLIALPLNLRNVEASPVRAILLPLKSQLLS